MKRACLLTILGVLALARPALAQEPRSGQRGDELEDRIPAVSGHLFLKQGRHEIAPLFDLTLADAFRRKFIVGAAYGYHFDESWAVSARFGYTFGTAHSGSVQVCPTPEECAPPTDAQLDALPGNLEMMGALAVEFAPLYGKINFIAEKVLHFDFYATAGAALTRYELVLPAEDKSGMGPGVMLGVGQRYFLADWFALRIEALDLLYLQPTARDDSSLQNQLMFTVGASFFLPTYF